MTIFKRFFKLFIFLIFFNNQIYSQEKKELTITAKYTYVQLTEILAGLEKDYSLKFYFQEEWIKGKVIDTEFRDASLELVLTELLSGTSCDFEIIQSNIVVLLPREEVATLKGKIKNYSADSYHASLYEIGNPSEAGKHRIVELSGIVTDGKTGEALFGEVT